MLGDKAGAVAWSWSRENTDNGTKEAGVLGGNQVAREMGQTGGWNGPCGQPQFPNPGHGQEWSEVGGPVLL